MKTTDFMIVDPVHAVHQVKVNGCSGFTPTLDDAELLLEEAHAVLVLAGSWADGEAPVADQIGRIAIRAAERLLHLGIASLRVGHEVLLAAHRSAH